jgi:hypothetical protein
MTLQVVSTLTIKLRSHVLADPNGFVPKSIASADNRRPDCLLKSNTLLFVLRQPGFEFHSLFATTTKLRIRNSVPSIKFSGRRSIGPLAAKVVDVAEAEVYQRVRTV